jgi:hypothetical protein
MVDLSKFRLPFPSTTARLIYAMSSLDEMQHGSSLVLLHEVPSQTSGPTSSSPDAKDARGFDIPVISYRSTCTLCLASWWNVPAW